MGRLADGWQAACWYMLPRTSRPHQAQGKSFVVCPPVLKSYLPMDWLEPVPGGSELNPHVQVNYIVLSPLSFPAG